MRWKKETNLNSSSPVKRNETAPPLTTSPVSLVSFWSMLWHLMLHAISNKARPIGSLLAIVVCARSHDQVEVGMRKPILLDVWEEPEEGGHVGDIGGCHLASIIGEDAADAAKTISDDGTQIAVGREGT